MNYHENFGFEGHDTKKLSVNKRISTPLGDLRPSNNLAANYQVGGGMEIESQESEENVWGKKKTGGLGNANSTKLGPNFGVSQQPLEVQSKHLHSAGMMEEEKPSNLNVRMQQRINKRAEKSEAELRKDHDEIIDVIIMKEDKVLIEHRSMIEKLVEIIKGDMQLIQKTESAGRVPRFLAS